MLKKYFYVSILIGAIALSGCTDDEDDNKEITAESVNTEQVSTINKEIDTTKVVTPIPLNLTQEQKEEYYKKYVNIVEKVNAENEEDFTLELEPITAFLDDDWIEVEDFERLAKERANATIVVVENNERYNPMSVPKTVKLQIGSTEANIIFEGSFNTQHTFDIPGGGQIFSAFNGITSEATDASGSWTQLGYTDLQTNDGIIYPIIVGGKYSQSGIISSHNIEIEFHCDKNGGIS